MEQQITGWRTSCLYAHLEMLHCKYSKNNGRMLLVQSLTEAVILSGKKKQH